MRGLMRRLRCCLLAPSLRPHSMQSLPRSSSIGVTVLPVGQHPFHVLAVRCVSSFTLLVSGRGLQDLQGRLNRLRGYLPTNSFLTGGNNEDASVTRSCDVCHTAFAWIRGYCA